MRHSLRHKDKMPHDKTSRSPKEIVMIVEKKKKHIKIVKKKTKISCQSVQKGGAHYEDKKLLKFRYPSGNNHLEK